MEARPNTAMNLTVACGDRRLLPNRYAYYTNRSRGEVTVVD